MKCNVINLIRLGGDALQAEGDGAAAYALHEMANNLLRVLQGEESFEEFAKTYIAGGCTPLDLDKHFPPPSPEDDGDAA